MNNELHKRLARFVVYAVTGRGKVGVTILVYSVLAALLLAYVSAQVYAGVLRSEITELEKQRLASRETLNKLVGRYVSLSTRGRVSEYCRTVLGMESVGGENLEIVAVSDDVSPEASVAMTREHEALPPPQRYTARRSDRNVGQ